MKSVPVKGGRVKRAINKWTDAVEVDSRICFSIAYFATEAEADEYGAAVRAAGITYNGGWFHGMPCGRDKSWDKTTADGRKLYAVTD